MIHPNTNRKVSGKNEKETSIEAKKIVLACHYPYFINPLFLPFKTCIKKGFLIATEVNKNKRFNAISEQDNTKSIRYYSDNKDYLIYCSEVNKLYKNIDNEKKYNNIIWDVKANFSESIKYKWFNVDIVTSDSLPIIGYVNKNNKNILIGTGYNLWGMTNGSIAGKILSDLILSKKNQYEKLFEPNRDFIISKLPFLIKNNTINGFNYFYFKLFKKHTFYKTAQIITKDGIDYGIYTDSSSKKHIVYNKCPHMKCSLIFNEVDKTWDCPCHSSRFDIDGKVVKGPSIYSISIDKKKI